MHNTAYNRQSRPDLRIRAGLAASGIACAAAYLVKEMFSSVLQMNLEESGMYRYITVSLDPALTAAAVGATIFERPDGSSPFSALNEVGLYYPGNTPEGTIYSIESAYSMRVNTAWDPQEAVDYFVAAQYANSDVLNNAYTFIGTGVSEFDHSCHMTANGKQVKYIWHSFIIKANPNETILHNSGYTLIAR